MDKNKKSKSKSWLQTLAIVIAIACVFPLWLKMGKEKVYEKDGLKIYASEQVNKADVERVADQALALLKEHGIKTQGTTSVVFYDTRQEFKVRNLFISSGALAMNWWPFPYITFAPVDMANDKQFARKEILNERPVHSVLAHELVHTYQAEQLNIIGYKYQTMLHKWKTEGMAEVVSESSSVPMELGLELFMNKADKQEIEAMEIAGEYFYFKSHLKVDYLLNYKKVSEAEFWSGDYDEEALEEEVRKAIKSGEWRAESGEQKVES